MDERTDRSRFWVVSTYVLTCGFAFPALAGALAVFANVQLHLDGYRALALVFGAQGLGYVFGMFHALGYIRRSASVPQPTRCIKPSLVSFSVMGALGFVVNALSPLPAGGEPSRAVALLAFVGFYAVIFATFVRVTRHGFHLMEHEQQARARL